MCGIYLFSIVKHVGMKSETKEYNFHGTAKFNHQQHQRLTVRIDCLIIYA